MVQIDFEGFTVVLERTRKGLEVVVRLQDSEVVLARTYASDGISTMMREMIADGIV